MKNIYESQEFYVVASPDGFWHGSNTGPYSDLRWAQKEAAQWSRYAAEHQKKVVKMVPLFFDMETGELLTPLPDGLGGKILCSKLPPQMHVAVVGLCEDCVKRGNPDECPMCRKENSMDFHSRIEYIVDETEDKGFCHKGEVHATEER